MITWTSIGVLLQGVYLLTSIGLNITKRTEYYPIATAAAAGTNVALNFLLIPRYGIVGAAWANGAAYATQAALGFLFSQRFYRIEYEWARLARVAAIAIVAATIARMLPAVSWPGVNARASVAPLPDVVLRGTTVVVVYGGLLALTGFFNTEELRWLRSLRRRRRDPAVAPARDSTEMAGEIVATDVMDSSDMPVVAERVR